MGKYKKYTTAAAAFTALLFIYSIFVINMIISDKSFSDTENRVLQQKPKISAKNIFKGRFTTEFENYISDQFVLRDFWVGIKSDIDRLAGKKESNEVYLGRDGYLLQKLVKPSDEAISKRAEAVNSFAAKVPGVKIYAVLAPNSAQIEKNKLPYKAPTVDQLFYINRAEEKLDPEIKTIDVADALKKHSDEYIYYKTDHHWTTKGAHIAYEQISKAMGFTPAGNKDYNIMVTKKNFYGSLYSKGGFRHIGADSIEIYTPVRKQAIKVSYSDEKNTADSLYNYDNLNKKDKYTVFLDGNHPLSEITTQNSGGSLLVIKDSYANSLIPFLAEHFSKIYIADLRYYNKSVDELVKKNNISSVLILYNANTFFEDTSIEHICW